ncbi:hypothetical protein [Streptomyces cahuitamycinicus]|uniref:hypothetical protein n=1 Tax=Streptomyces cahuitamycinicus TaxID=2070367 RepID=UPI001FE3EBDB|nr:hypothetical protein [Streptomyces cahuitamycinicus]
MAKALGTKTKKVTVNTALREVRTRHPALAAESYAGITPWMRERVKTRSASRRWHQASR